MTENALYYALSTIAQVAAALAALVGFLGLWRLDRLRDERSQTEQRIAELLLRLAPETYQRYGGSFLVEQARFFATSVQSDSKGDYTPAMESRFKRLFARLDALPGEQRRLMCMLIVFLIVTLGVILAPAIAGIVHVEWLKTRAWTPWLLYGASGLLAIAPICLMLLPTRSIRLNLTSWAVSGSPLCHLSPWRR